MILSLVSTTIIRLLIAKGKGGKEMKQTIDAIMQIATLVMSVICFGIGIINIKEDTEYLAISMALVSVSFLFSRIQDKEEK